MGSRMYPKMNQLEQQYEMIENLKISINSTLIYVSNVGIDLTLKNNINFQHGVILTK